MTSPTGSGHRVAATRRHAGSPDPRYRDVATVVMTGATSGFGAIAAERLTQSGNARLILGARRPTSVGESMPLDPDRDPDRDAGRARENFTLPNRVAPPTTDAGLAA